MQLDFFCVAEDIQLKDNIPSGDKLVDRVIADTFPVTVRCAFACIIIGTKDERPEYFDLAVRLENEQGESQQGFSISVRSNHGYDVQNPQPLRSMHVLPTGEFKFNQPGTYTVRLTLEGSNSMEQVIAVTRN